MHSPQVILHMKPLEAAAAISCFQSPSDEWLTRKSKDRQTDGVSPFISGIPYRQTGEETQLRVEDYPGSPPRALLVYLHQWSSLKAQSFLRRLLLPAKQEEAQTHAHCNSWCNASNIRSKKD